MAGGRRSPPSMERLWLGELRREHAIINIITITALREVARDARLVGEESNRGHSRRRASRPPWGRDGQPTA
jgi:hypothetical protein